MCAQVSISVSLCGRRSHVASHFMLCFDNCQRETAVKDRRECYRNHSAGLIAQLIAMAESNMPIIEPTIDYTKVPPIHQKRTISFINHFVVNTVSFLNKLALTCEEKLFEFENKLQRIEAAVVILESRLASIPGLEDKSPTKDSPDPKPEESNESQSVPAEEVTKDVDETDREPAEKPVPEIKENTQPISEHPTYKVYFRLLKVGVRIEEIKQKMVAEGRDPELLDDPHRQVPRVETENNDAAS